MVRCVFELHRKYTAPSPRGQIPARLAGKGAGECQGITADAAELLVLKVIFVVPVKSGLAVYGGFCRGQCPLFLGAVHGDSALSCIQRHSAGTKNFGLGFCRAGTLYLLTVLDRRTGATLMYLAGVDVYDIMRVTGHSSPAVLKRKTLPPSEPPVSLRRGRCCHT